MFELVSENIKPQRVVVLGASGFVGKHLVRLLKDREIEFMALSSKELDLRDESSAAKLQNILRPTDVLVFISALAPNRDFSQFKQNIDMAYTVCRTLASAPVKQCIYISSDAVYSEEASLVNEKTPPSPTSLHGLMHLSREVMLQSVVKEIPLAILRLSLLYGIGDPHNGYGPNRFFRLVEKNEDISFFGGGEEKRDHVHIEDAAEVIFQVIRHRGKGVLNVATGNSISFLESAEIIVSETKSSVSLFPTQRQNVIKHRHFDVTHLSTLFPDFHFKTFSEGVKQMAKQLKESKYG